MNEVDYDKLKKSFDRLVEQYEFFNLNEHTLSGNIKEAVKESIIQRFEICYDTLWKHLKKYLETQGLTDIPNSPVPIFRKAHENQIINSTESLQNWFNYNKLRIGTTHDYSGEKADQALSGMGGFIDDAGDVYQKITAK